MDAASFERTGIYGPWKVLSAEECRGVVAVLDAQPAPLDWFKGRAITGSLYSDLARRPEVLAPVRALLGPAVMLWGASPLRSAPGYIHPHHVDIETALTGAGTVTVWIGLEGTSRDSSLRFVAGSHRFSEPLQQVAHDAGRHRGEFGEDEVLAWAAARDPAAAIVSLDVADGEAVIFDGRLWHGSRNTTAMTRRAVLLQFAVPTTPIRIPDFGEFEWPFRFHDAPLTPCLLVSGEANDTSNRLLPLPARPGAPDPVLTSWAGEIDLPLATDPSGFRPHQLFRGTTGHLDFLNCHVSTLSSGVSPHPPHVHDDEEILLMLSGEAEVTFENAAGMAVQRLRPGSLTYYPTGRAHTLRAVGESNAEYLMLKWMAPARPGFATLDGSAHLGAAEPGAPRFEGATTYLGRLRCHDSTVEPGAGYPPHVDAHDVAIILLSGTVETMGAKLSAPAVAFTAAGVPHGLSNPGAEPAHYVVFEFEGNPAIPTLTFASAGAAPQPPGLLRRAHAGWWSAGGRALRRTPRLHAFMRRALRPLSPWR